VAERLPELKPLKGKHRVFKYYGESKRLRFKSFLSDYRLISDPAVLVEEGKQHRTHQHLTFSNCVANVGDGPVILEITRTSGLRARVAQVVRDDARPRRLWRRKGAGRAVYDPDPDHRHYHYSGFLLYTLRSVRTGRLVGTAKKQSFCLEDVAKLDRGVGRRGFARCPDRQAKTGHMGISPGWGDVYWAGLHEQYIEVKGLPSGDYWLECVVDPASLLAVKSRRSTSTKVRVRL